MINEELKIGFIGLGEAGFHLARGLRQVGLGNISAYDINTHTPGLGERIQRRAAESEVVLVESNVELAGACEIMLSTVTANRAQEAAEQEHTRMLAELRREVVHLVIQTTTAVVGKVLTADDERRVAEESARHLATS